MLSRHANPTLSKPNIVAPAWLTPCMSSLAQPSCIRRVDWSLGLSQPAVLNQNPVEMARQPPISDGYTTGAYTVDHRWKEKPYSKRRILRLLAFLYPGHNSKFGVVGRAVELLVKRRHPPSACNYVATSFSSPQAELLTHPVALGGYLQPVCIFLRPSLPV